MFEPGDSPPQNPAHDRQHNADEDAGSDRKVESEIAFSNCNVSRQVSQPAKPRGKFPKQYPDCHQPDTGDYREFSNFLHRLNNR